MNVKVLRCLPIRATKNSSSSSYLMTISCTQATVSLKFPQSNRAVTTRSEIAMTRASLAIKMTLLVGTTNMTGEHDKMHQIKDRIRIIANSMRNFFEHL